MYRHCEDAGRGNLFTGYTKHYYFCHCEEVRRGNLFNDNKYLVNVSST